ncbi:MAG: hypothetical protein K9J13_08790, partial [Saprospiraceae bacterium]|nr:hypothetical protein [Saprospiraceae bacterium]
MNKYTDYSIFIDKKLIIRYFSGEIYVKDIIDLLHKTSLDENYDPTFNVIHDFRNGNVKLDRTDTTQIAKYLKSNLAMYGRRNSVSLTSEPNQVALSIIFETQIQDFPLNFHIVSTMEAAVKCVCLHPFDSNIIESH